MSVYRRVGSSIRTLAIGNWVRASKSAAPRAAAALVAACSGDDTALSIAQPVMPGPEGAAESLFAVPTEVYGADFASSTSFVPIVPSLDVERVGLDQAREKDGRASVMTIGNYLYVASSSAPVIERFEVQADGTLLDAGRLSFANYGLPEFFSIDAWGSITISPTKAYVFNRGSGSHVVWNPTTLEITGEIEGPDVLRDGWDVESVAVVRGNRLFRIFAYLDYDTWRFDSSTQYLAVYDVESDRLSNLVQDARCPLLYSRPFIDEAGDIYFSGWVWTAAEALVNGAPKNCALRVRAGQETFDPDWQLIYSDDVTEGREAGILRYLGGGQALLDVFHHERASLGGELSTEELSNTPNWRLWSVDLEQRSGAPVDGLDFKAGGYQDVNIDGRTFLMVPNDDYSETTAYEISLGQAAAGFKIRGSSYHMVKLR